jgi:hypothetical protein
MSQPSQEPARDQSADPGLLTPEAIQLIDGQYADRPHLRPVLDAVLASLPALGPVVVEARKTFVSLVSPRRTFAVVQATTKQRVDLGLRLDRAQPDSPVPDSPVPDSPAPGNRLLAARNLGTATVRMALTGPGEFDEEALSWLRRAYEQNTAPPPPRRRPAPRPKPEPAPLVVVIEGCSVLGPSFSPGPDGSPRDHVHLALRGTGKDRTALIAPGHPWQAIEPVSGDAREARWEVEITVMRGDDGLDFGGPFIRGDRTDRHLGLVWGDISADGTFELICGAKLRLADVDNSIVVQALNSGRRLLARVRLTDADGHPNCARLKPPNVSWSVIPA